MDLTTYRFLDVASIPPVPAERPRGERPPLPTKFVDLQIALREREFERQGRMAEPSAPLHDGLEWHPDGDPDLVRQLLDEFPDASSAAAAHATIEWSPGGASLVEARGGEGFENGPMYSAKSRRIVHVQGETAMELVLREQSAHRTVDLSTEACIVRWPGRWARPDISITLSDGSRMLIEAKRSRADLADPVKREQLACVAAICRAHDVAYGVVLRNGVWAGPRHRAQAVLFSSRALVPVPDALVDRLRDFCGRKGAVLPLAEVRDQLGEGDALMGMGRLQALTVSRLLEIDVTVRLHDASPVTVH